jgi:hypothetical protein
MYNVTMGYGQSIVGKSSISKGVYRQTARQDKIYCLHEECEVHPIRYEEFNEEDIRVNGKTNLKLIF